MSGGGDYLAAAFLVFFALLLVYVVIMAVRMSRMERELAELNEIAARRDDDGGGDRDRDPVEVPTS
jgi:CcmD family protein